MSIYSSKLWLSDIDRLLSKLEVIKELEGKTILITGSTGLICSSIIDVLIRYNETHDKTIKIIAAGRDENKINKRFDKYANKKYFSYLKYDASKINVLDFKVDYIIHGASNAYPSAIINEPVETMLGNFIGLNDLFNLAVKNNTKRVLYISSSEIYGQKKKSSSYSEEEYGYIDILNSRNSYSVSKRAAETLCVCYSDEYNVESVIVRPGHIYGPTASLNDNRVSSSFAHFSAKGEDIVMKSNGEQLRSYCYCLDCASAILVTLINGKSKEAYNISDPNSIITIKEMAEKLSTYGNVKLQLNSATESEKKSFNPMNNSSLCSTKIMNIGWKPLFTNEEGFDHTIKILKDVYYKN